MEQVAQFINAASPRQALARLCRLAVAPVADGRRRLDDWERLVCDDTVLDKALSRLDDDVSSVQAVEIADHPLLWLRALDEHCNLGISPDSYVKAIAIDDGTGHSYLLPLYPGHGGGAHARQYGNLARWLKHHRVIPLDNPQGIPVAVAGLRGYTEWTAARTAGNNIKLALAHFTDRARPKIELIEPAHFICPSLEDNAARLDSAMAAIRDAKANGAHLLVMPELCIPNEMRRQIIAALFDSHAEQGEDHDLAVPIIVLGSFHEQSPKGWRNRAVVISGLDGGLLFVSDKRKSVTFDNRKENLECAVDFTCLATPIGLMAVAICKDLFEEAPAALLRSLPLDWLLVPSMSNKVTPHKAAAKTLYATAGTVVAVANQQMPGCAKDRPGFVQHQLLADCALGLTMVDVANASGTTPLRVVKTSKKS